MSHLFHEQLSVSAEARALRQHQRPHCFWLTGLSGSGKSTLANALDAHLNTLGVHSYLLDGDILRHGLNSNLGFSDADRLENVRRAAHAARLMHDAGLITIVALISPLKVMRDQARSLFPAGSFSEIHVSCTVETCMQRDPKGVYAKQRLGLIQGISGLDALYEAPEQPELTIQTEAAVPQISIQQLICHAEHALNLNGASHARP